MHGGVRVRVRVRVRAARGRGSCASGGGHVACGGVTGQGKGLAESCECSAAREEGGHVLQQTRVRLKLVACFEDSEC